MRLGVVGGKLQGIECTYLAGKAGYEVVVIDRHRAAPALSLADEVVILDVVSQVEETKRVLSDCDAVLPANEELTTLTALDRICRQIKVPLLFDLEAYRTSSSKVLSNELLRELNVPMPLPWPECGYPVVVKPSSFSGSVGVMRADNGADLARGLQRVKGLNDAAVVQEFVEGPNISIEVIGDGDRAVPLVTTEVILDESYDCRMVLCPLPGVDQETEGSFREWGRRIAERMSIRGIMDVEAIVHKGVPKVLEIDARMPSQTPAAAYNATGVNLVEVLVGAIVGKRLEEPVPKQGAAIYEHLAVDGATMRSCGEGTFAQVRQPRLMKNLFGSDEMITDYEPGRKSWKATMICTGATPEEAWERRNGCIDRIIESNQISQYIVPSTEGRT
mgnify:CR=1 FL=1